MFRLLESSLPKDFHAQFPTDLEKLGYFINDEDQIRMVKDPSQEFHYFISKNDRVLDVQREAMNISIRRNVMSRLLSSSLSITRLPIDTPANQNHVPVLTSTNLSTAKRVIIYIGESSQDLGIFAYRVVGKESIASGSAIEFTKTVHDLPDSPALVIANPGQLIWHRRGQEAVTQPTWYALPRRSAVSGPIRLDSVKNRIPKNENVQQHLKCVFDEVLGQLASQDARIHVVANGDGAHEVVEFLQEEWDKWGSRIDAMVVGASHIWRTAFEDSRFQEFWGKRARAYLLSPEKLDEPLTGRDHFGCNCYSAGEAAWTECILPRAHSTILRYFQMVADNPSYYERPQMVLPEESEVVQDESEWTEA